MSTDDATDHQHQRQHCVDREILLCMQDRRRCRYEDDLKERRPDNDVGWHSQEINHGRDHDEPAADTHDARQKADEHADKKRRNALI